MSKQPQPTWQPITQLPLIASAIDGMLELAEEQYAILQQARSKPHVLDNHTVGRVIAVYTTQRDDLWLYAEQLRRWTAQKVTDAQRREAGRLTGQLERLGQVVTDILALADELKGGTIEQMLAKSDEQLGLEFLLRHSPSRIVDADPDCADGAGRRGNDVNCTVSGD